MPRVVFLADDPARDKPVLKPCTSNFGSRFIGISGSLDAIPVLVDGVGDHVHREALDKTVTVVHIAAVNVVDPSGASSRLCCRPSNRRQRLSGSSPQ